MNFFTSTAGHKFLGYKRNEEVLRRLKVEPAEEKMTYKSNWQRRVTRINNNRMPQIMLNYRPNERRRLGRHLKGLLYEDGRFQWPCGLWRRSAAARLLRLWVRIPPGAWMFVCCECCVLSGRGLCDELITRPVESYRLWCVVVCDLETS